MTSATIIMYQKTAAKNSLLLFSFCPFVLHSSIVGYKIMNVFSCSFVKVSNRMNVYHFLFPLRCSKTITVIIITKMKRNQRKSRLKITKCLTDIPTNISTTTTNTTKATRPTSATKSRDTRVTGDGERPGRKRRKLTKSPAKA